MNDIISQLETIYIEHRISFKLREIVEQFPVTVLTGARQVGKSTLLRHDFPDFRYHTLDDFTVREQARLDPQSLWIGTDRLIIDEAQKASELFDAIKPPPARGRGLKPITAASWRSWIVIFALTDSVDTRQ